MARNHIRIFHFLTILDFAKGLPGDNQVISGMRYSCNVIIEIDMAKAIKDGYKFYKSLNDVILCPGKGEDGALPPTYFSKVHFMDLDTKQMKTVEPKQYKYLLVLDFEANCVDKGSLECQEIIEFPVVPIDTETLKPVCDPFHYYIKPTVCPEITEFCTELTGIEQGTVDKGITIEEALKRLYEWREEHGFTAENSTYVTCGAWDLKTCLRMEAEYKKLSYQGGLNKFINIKDIWMQLMFKNKATGMPGMLTSLDLDLDGKHHSGIDDSKNIAKIAIELIKKGGTFTQFQDNVVSKKPSKKAMKKIREEKKQKK